MKQNKNKELEKLLGINKLIHEPARLSIIVLLHLFESVDFLFIQEQTGLTQGNLSSHISKLEQAEIIEVEKKFVGKRPRTILKLSSKGQQEFDAYTRLMKNFYKSL